MEDVDREYYQGVIAELRAAIVRIDAINDNPACFSEEINDLCGRILRPHLYQQQRSEP